MKILTDYDGLYAKIEANKEIILSMNKGYQEIFDKVGEAGFSTDFPFFYCFPVAQFMFYYLGGYDTMYELRCIRGIPLDLGNGTIERTTHWYVFDNETQTIIDLTKAQFDNDMVDIEDYYETARRANFGYPFFKKGQKRYEKTVPCRRVLNLYHALRDEIESPHLEWLYQESMKSGVTYK